jgi:hypothetical protein
MKKEYSASCLWPVPKTLVIALWKLHYCQGHICCQKIITLAFKSLITSSSREWEFEKKTLLHWIISLGGNSFLVKDPRRWAPVGPSSPPCFPLSARERYRNLYRSLSQPGKRSFWRLEWDIKTPVTSNWSSTTKTKMPRLKNHRSEVYVFKWKYTSCQPTELG